MKIIVCVKQVPDTTDIRWTENNTLIRDGVESVVNPCDYYAIESALKVKDYNENTQITAISMGPKQAENALKEVLSMGVDDAFLLCDRFFAGSDTASTARVLAAGIKEKCNDFDIVLCGQYASDGDTAQTGPSLAQNLNIAIVTNVIKIEKIEQKYVVVRKITEEGILKIKIELPTVICMLKNDETVRMPKISGRMKAQDYNLPIYNAQDIGFNAEFSGFKGSPTYVKKAFRPQGHTLKEFYSDMESEQSANLLIKKLFEKELSNE
ncbi:electron transfer flavoprotein subunit beta/FixA family protein [bacterium]|nr:electron transfer flavoprotein subunit beta/FixA family protein [bacterium]